MSMPASSSIRKMHRFSLTRRRLIQTAVGGTMTSTFPAAPAGGRPATCCAADGTVIHFETHGDPRKPAVFLGPHFYASRTEDDEVHSGPWIEALRREFFLIIADYPRGIGRTPAPQGLAFNPDVATEEYLRIADAAQVDRFGWFGYSFGGAMGVQIACRSHRIAALVVGGFPPLHAPMQRLVEIHRRLQESSTPLPPGIDAGVIRSAIGFYAALVNWPERAEIAKLSMPRLAFMGVEDGMPEDERELSLADTLRSVEDELRRLEWRIEWLPGENHSSAIRPDASLALVLAFLREALPLP